MITEIVDVLNQWLPFASILTAFAGLAATLWSFARTRRKYYEDYLNKREEN
jgi:hypothetical protein